MRDGLNARTVYRQNTYSNVPSNVHIGSIKIPLGIYCAKTVYSLQQYQKSNYFTIEIRQKNKEADAMRAFHPSKEIEQGRYLIVEQGKDYFIRLNVEFTDLYMKWMKIE